MDERQSVQDKLYDAISNGELESVKFCLENGAKINAMGPSWRNIKTFPLQLAISCHLGNLEIIILLVENGAQIDVKDEKNQTPLDLALKNGYDDIANYLKKAEDEAREKAKKKKLKAEKKAFFDDLKNSEEEAKKMAEEEEKKKAKENDKTKAEEEWKKHVQNRLFDAICDGDLESVKFCLENGAEINVQGSRPKMKKFPLHMAISRNLVEIVKILLQNGADVNIKNRHAGSSPLHSAVFFK